MSDLSEQAVRKALDEFFEQEYAKELESYTERATAAAEKLGVDAEALCSAAEHAGMLVPPVKSYATASMVRYTKMILDNLGSEIETCVLVGHKTATIQLPVPDEYEDIPLAALRSLAAKLLNVKDVTRETGRADEGEEDETTIRASLWVDEAAGAAYERSVRLKRARDDLARHEEGLCAAKKRIADLGGTTCTCGMHDAV